MYVEGKAARGSRKAEFADKVAIDDDSDNGKRVLLLAYESLAEEVMLEAVIFVVFGYTDQVVGDQELSYRACLLSWRQIINVWMSKANLVYVVIKSPKNLLLRQSIF